MILKLLPLIVISILGVSCEENNEVEGNVECNFELDFTMTTPEDAFGIIELKASSSIENANYIWLADGEVIETNEQDLGTLTWSVSENADEFCVKLITDDCEEGKMVCKPNTYKFSEGDDDEKEEVEEIEEEKGNGCGLNLEFTYERISRNAIEVFAAEDIDFPVYVWKINGAYVETKAKNLEIALTKEVNEICLFQETPDCPKGEMICKTIEADINDNESNCSLDVDLDIEIEKGLDINVICDFLSFDQGVEYLWSVNGKAFSSEDSNILSWGPELGTTEFCVTVYTTECAKGEEHCVTFLLTEELLEKANGFKDDIAPIVNVIEIGDDEFSISISE